MQQATRPQLSICLAGAAPDTGNLGVSALCHSVLAGLHKRLAHLHTTVFDFGRGLRSGPLYDGRVDLCGAYSTRRVYRPESLFRVRMSARFRGLGNAAAQRVLQARALLDVSGGDSFTDLYGRRRFASITAPKLLALQTRIPLVLLPQTYGPFQSAKALARSAELARYAHIAIARDPQSFAVLQELLGACFDPSRHINGVDVAFLLPPARPRDDRWVPRFSDPSAETVGINISGLLYNDPRTAQRQFGLRADYREIIHGVVRRLLEQSTANLLLIPHVLTPTGHYESDSSANEQVLSRLVGQWPHRVAAVAPQYNEREMKWIIAATSWFFGTRMHSAIAALSSGVPTCALSYSPKTSGVFETCGQKTRVVDPRAFDTVEAVDQVWSCWTQRDTIRAALARSIGEVLGRASNQMDVVATFLSRSVA